MANKNIIIYVIICVIGIVVGLVIMYLFRPKPSTITEPDIDAIRRAQYIEDSTRFAVFTQKNTLVLDSLNKVIAKYEITNAYLWKKLQDEKNIVNNLPADPLVEFVSRFSSSRP